MVRFSHTFDHDPAANAVNAEPAGGDELVEGGQPDPHHPAAFQPRQVLLVGRGSGTSLGLVLVIVARPSARSPHRLHRMVGYVARA